MKRRPPNTTPTDPLFPYTTLCRSERVQHLVGLLGQADDALRADGPRHGYSIRFVHAPATTSPSYSQRSCRLESPAYQNSMEYGRTRRPVQRGGRGKIGRAHV